MKKKKGLEKKLGDVKRGDRMYCFNIGLLEREIIELTITRRNIKKIKITYYTIFNGQRCNFTLFRSEFSKPFVRFNGFCYLGTSTKHYFRAIADATYSRNILNRKTTTA